jgi:CBS domain-containing protein
MSRRQPGDILERPTMKKLREFMSSYLETISAGDSVKNAAARMRAFGIGCLLVRDDQELVGVITDRDIAIRVTAAGKNARTTAVSEVMSPGIICCSEDQDVEEAARMMEINHLHRIVLIDREGHPTGILSLGDLARNGYEELAGRILIAISQSVPAISGSPWFR